VAVVLVVYYSRHGSVAAMAEQVAAGIDAVNGCQSSIRVAAPVSADNQRQPVDVPDSGPPFVSLDDVRNCDGLAIGSPSYFGNMAAPLKHFIDSTSPLWMSGALIGKPAAVFSSASSLHGGIESVLTSMMIPLLHHGMIVCGLPYSEPALHDQTTAAAPYGATHVAFNQNSALSDDEKRACRALGKRLAELTLKLQ
jgi:NAD(P)H dehydrogenase (quinone)